MSYNELYQSRILELLKLCIDLETENEMLLKQIEYKSVKIKELENKISDFENRYLNIPIYPNTIKWVESPFISFTDYEKVKYVPYYSNMVLISQ